MGAGATPQQISQGITRMLKKKQKELKSLGISSTLKNHVLTTSDGQYSVNVIRASNAETAGILKYFPFRKEE